jgi:hypothetical protein
MIVPGGLVVSMLPSGSKVCGINPGQGQWIFNVDKKPQYAFLRRKVKLSAPCRKILRHVRTVRSMKEILHKAN